MKELEFIKTIQNTLTKNSHIGDDCAYLKDLGIVITHDSLVENIHFSTNYSTPYQIGYKSVMVNLSDIFAAGALPKYMTVSLSLPKDISNQFIKDFYAAVEALSKQFNFEVIGGDITGSEKIFISICAIGLTKNRKIASRGYAEVGDYVITTGNHGSSAAGLHLLCNNKKNSSEEKNSKLKKKLIEAHLMPVAQKKLSSALATTANKAYAMMDSSDGLVDAVFKIAQASNVLISIDFDKIPYEKGIEQIANEANIDFKNWILYGGEDFQIIACVNKEILKKLNPKTFTIIGRVKPSVKSHSVEIKLSGNSLKIKDLENTFNHFKN